MPSHPFTGSGPLSAAFRTLERQQRALTPRPAPGVLTSVSRLGVTQRPFGRATRRRTSTTATNPNVWL